MEGIKIISFFSTIKPDPVIKGHYFIGGCGHSGTTLIANILATHSQLYVPLRETRLFRTQKFKRRLRYNRLAQEVKSSGKSILMEKTPSHIRNIDEIRAIFPNVKMVVPVRDGRDVAASYFKRYNDKYRGIKAWIHLNEFAATNMNAGDFLVYRHEDLVEELEGTLRKICDFLEIPFEPDLLNYHTKSQKWHGHKKIKHTDKRTGRGHDKRRNWQVNQPIFNSSGSWKKYMSPDDLTELRTGRGLELMQLFGYAQEPAESNYQAT